MTTGSAANLTTPTFLKDVLSKELVPLNDRTDTDFILTGGITIAIRKHEQHLLLKVDQVPDHATFIVNNPSAELLAETGSNLIQRLFRLALIAVQKDRAKIIDTHEPNPELIAVIQEAMLLYAPPAPQGVKQRAIVLAPSPIQHGCLALFNKYPPERDRAFLNVMQPLLGEIPAGGVGFDEFRSSKHEYSEIRNGIDYIFAQDSFIAVGGPPEGISPVEIMKMLRDLDARIRKLGFDPDPILRAITN